MYAVIDFTGEQNENEVRLTLGTHLVAMKGSAPRNPLRLKNSE
jgi:hypothetical protein